MAKFYPIVKFLYVVTYKSLMYCKSNFFRYQIFKHMLSIDPTSLLAQNLVVKN